MSADPQFPADLYVFTKFSWLKFSKFYQTHFTPIFHFHHYMNPTDTPRGFHVETTWKRPFPRRFNVESTWCVCKEKCPNTGKNSRKKQ